MNKSARSFAVRVVIALALLVASEHRANAQGSEPDFQEWMQLYVGAKLPHALLLDLDLQARRVNAPLAAVRDARGNVLGYDQNPSTVLVLRPMLGYQALSWLSAWLGYAWVPDFFDDPALRGARNLSEHRVLEQLVFRNVWSQWDLSLRARFEQRVRTNGPGSRENDSGEAGWAHRYRQQARAAYTLVAGQPYQVIVWNELFVHLNETQFPSKPGFDQNRAFVGAGYQANPSARVELGYANQRVKRYSDPDQNNHVLLMVLSLKLPAHESCARHP